MERTTMSVQELSAQMGISLPKAYELVKTPGFPTLRIGTRILIPIDAYTTAIRVSLRRHPFYTPFILFRNLAASVSRYELCKISGVK